MSSIGGFYGSLNDIIYGPDDALYYTQLNPGEIHRVTPPGFEQRGLFGQTLTMTETSADQEDAERARQGHRRQPRRRPRLGPGPDASTAARSRSGPAPARRWSGTFPLANGGWSYTGPVAARNGLKFKALNKTDPITGVTIKQGKTLRSRARAPA